MTLINVRNNTRGDKRKRRPRQNHRLETREAVPDVTYKVTIEEEVFVITGKGSVDNCELLLNTQLRSLCQKMRIPSKAIPTHVRAVDGDELLEQLEIIKKYVSV